MDILLKTYWWNGQRNFGDELTPLILQFLGFNPILSESYEAEICVVGSILEAVGVDFSGAVIGSGFIQDGNNCKMSNAQFFAVRGPLTASRLGLKNIVLGDPGILCPLLTPTNSKPHIRVGIVPHYKDKNNIALLELADRYTDQILIIDPQRDPITIIKEIQQCETVLSSSLHGLISADAFGRKTAWLELSNEVVGSGYKFRDYYGAFELYEQSMSLHGSESLEMLDSMSTFKHIAVFDKQNELIECFRKFRALRGHDLSN